MLGELLLHLLPVPRGGDVVDLLQPHPLRLAQLGLQDRVCPNYPLSQVFRRDRGQKEKGYLSSVEMYNVYRESWAFLTISREGRG